MVSILDSKLSALAALTLVHNETDITLAVSWNGKRVLWIPTAVQVLVIFFFSFFLLMVLQKHYSTDKNEEAAKTGCKERRNGWECQATCP